VPSSPRCSESLSRAWTRGKERKAEMKMLVGAATDISVMWREMFAKWEERE